MATLSVEGALSLHGASFLSPVNGLHLFGHALTRGVGAFGSKMMMPLMLDRRHDLQVTSAVYTLFIVAMMNMLIGSSLLRAGSSKWPRHSATSCLGGA